MFQIKLTYNLGAEWYTCDESYVKGYAYTTIGEFYREKNLLDILSSHPTASSLKSILKSLDGCFSFIINYENTIFLGVDKARSFPLFYTLLENRFIVSDNIHYFQNLMITNILENSKNEFLSAGTVFGNKTLFENIYEVEAGSFNMFSEENITKIEYFDFITRYVSKNDYNNQKLNLEAVFNSIFKSLSNELKKHKVVLPLSGGYDSRLIAVMLKKYGITNVLCYTYGNKENQEVEISKEVAKRLGFEWIFIEYSQELIDGYDETNTFQEFYKYASGGVSQFFMQEFFAVRYLKENNLVPEISIFLPGYAGDFLGGDHITKYFLKEKMSLTSCKNRIFRYLIDYCPPTKKVQKSLKKQITQKIEKNPKETSYNYSFVENWDYKEKLVKLIINTAKTFDFFGYQYCLVFWNNMFIDFSRELPLKYKKYSKIYYEVLEELFKESNVAFEKELKPVKKDYRLKKFKDSLKLLLGLKLGKPRGKKTDKYNSNISVRKVLGPKLNEGIPNISLSQISNNMIITKWYIEQIEKQSKAQ